MYGPSSPAARVAEANQRGKERTFKVEEAKAVSVHRVGSNLKGMQYLLCLSRPSPALRLQDWLASP
eukprot:3808534-Pyramimonas_sp.AAC.1